MIRTMFIALMALMVIGSAAFAAEAIVIDLEGLAFYSTGGSWFEVQEGATIPQGARIFSGSGSSLSLDISGDNVEVDPLTDFNLVSTRNTEDASVLYVRAGGLRAQVATAREDENGVRFQIQSPVATASVRGTIFTFNGTDLSVEEGDVQLKNILGQRHSVREGQTSRAFGNENISSVEVYLRRNTSVE